MRDLYEWSVERDNTMDKMILKDKTEIEIMEGAGMYAITAVVGDWTELGTVADAIRTAGNLEEIQFETSDKVMIGTHRDMRLEMPLFRVVDVVDGKIRATFAIREKTEIEKRLDVQDGAIMELAGMMGGK